MKNSIYRFSIKSFLLYTYLIFTVLPSKATILKFSCVGSFGYDVSYKTTLNLKNQSRKKSRPIFTENKKLKSFIVSYDLENGNGFIDGNKYSEIIEGNSLLFKSKSYQRTGLKDGSIKKSTKRTEVFTFIIDDFKNLKIKGSSYFTALKRREIRNSKINLKETSFKTYENEIKKNYEFTTGWCQLALQDATN